MVYDDKAAKRTYKYVQKCMRVGFVMKPGDWQVWKNQADKENLPFNTFIRKVVNDYIKSLNV